MIARGIIESRNFLDTRRDKNDNKEREIRFALYSVFTKNDEGVLWQTAKW